MLELIEIILAGLFGDMVDFINESIELLRCLILGQCVR